MRVRIGDLKLSCCCCFLPTKELISEREWGLFLALAELSADVHTSKFDRPGSLMHTF